MFVIDSATALRVLREDDAAELFALTDANRAFLRRWLPWVDLVMSEDDSRSFLETVTLQREEGRGPTFGIVQRRRFGGCRRLLAHRSRQPLRRDRLLARRARRKGAA